MSHPDLLMAVMPVVDAFERLGVKYYIGGSIASSAHGIARATMDIDCVADLTREKAGQLTPLLENEYYIDEQMIIEAIRQNTCFNLIHLKTIIKVDVFIVKNRPYDQCALERRKKDTLDEGEDTPEVFIASPEDIILAKLVWFDYGGRNSEKQWNDILGVLKVQKGCLDLKYLNHWARELRLSDLLDLACKEAN